MLGSAMTLEECLRKVREIEEMARVVSLSKDRTALEAQAQAWRERCAELERRRPQA